MLKIELDKLEQIISTEIAERRESVEGKQAKVRLSQLNSQLAAKEAESVAFYPFQEGEEFTLPQNLSPDQHAVLTRVGTTGKSLAYFQEVAKIGEIPGKNKTGKLLGAPLRWLRKKIAQNYISQKHLHRCESGWLYSQAVTAHMETRPLREEMARLEKFSDAAMDDYAVTFNNACQKLRKERSDHAFIPFETNEMGLISPSGLSLESQAQIRETAAKRTVGNSKLHEDPTYMGAISELLCLSKNGRILWNYAQKENIPIFFRDSFSEATPEAMRDLVEVLRLGRDKASTSHDSDNSSKFKLDSAGYCKHGAGIVIVKRNVEEILQSVDTMAHEIRHLHVLDAFQEEIDQAQKQSLTLTNKILEADAYAVADQVMHEIDLALGVKEAVSLQESFNLMGHNCCARFKCLRFLQGNEVKQYEMNLAHEWQQKISRGEWERTTEEFSLFDPNFLKRIMTMPDGTSYLKESEIPRIIKDVSTIQCLVPPDPADVERHKQTAGTPKAPNNPPQTGKREVLSL